MRSETFPYPERFSQSASKLGVVAYFDTGAPPQTPGASPGRPLPPIVLIHALFMNYTTWEYVAPVLAQHTRVIGLDLPGCGHSAKPRHAYRVADMVAAVRGLLDELGIEKAVILGHSYGGRVAMELAFASPERVAGLILMSSAGFVRYRKILHVLGPALLHEKLVTTLSLSVNRAVLRLLFGSGKEGRAHRERFLSQVVDRYDPRFGVEFARYTVPMLSELMSEVYERLPSLTTPVQVLWGEDDHLISLGDAREGIAQLPRARLDVLPGCGHMANLEQPEAVSATALRFLREVSP